MNIETEERLLFLKKIPLLGCLPNETLADPRYCAIKKYAKGETIFSEGNENNYLYILLEGLVKLMFFSEDGNAQILHFATKGDFLGDISAQLEKVSAIAQTPAEIVAIPKMQFKRFLHNHEFAACFIAMLCRRNNLYQEKMLLKSIKRAKERLAAADKILAPIVNNGQYKLIDQEIGEFCSFRRETVTRDREMLSFGKRLTMKEKIERNRKIITEVRNGEQPASVAARYGISECTVYQVLKEVKWPKKGVIRIFPWRK